MNPPAPAAPPRRLFIAADLEPADRARLGALAARVADATGGQAVAAANLHVTLHFLGDVAPERLPALAEALAAEAGGPAALVGEGSLRARPRAQRARLVALELEDAGGTLAALAARLAPAVGRALGAPAPVRPLWPHITLTRMRRPGPVALPAHAGAERTFGISRASLYDSRQTPGGPPRYVRVAGISLGTTT